MMSNSTSPIDLALRFAAHGQVLGESAGSLRLRGAFADWPEQSAWLGLRAAPVDPVVGVQIYDAEIGGDLGDAEAFEPGRPFAITLLKAPVPGMAIYVLESTAADSLREGPEATSLLIAGLDDRAGFAARGLVVGAYPAVDAASGASIPIDPRKFVRDYVPEREVPSDLSPWLLSRRPAIESAVFTVWKRVAARRLLAALAASVLKEGGEIWAQAGPPPRRFRLEDPALAAAWEALTAAAEWVFLAGQDIEARHLIYAVELARADAESAPFEQVADRALEAAKATYEAHVQSSSRETLKALADLRKTVVDETQKVTQRAQDMAAGLWRDLAVSASPFVLKIFSDAARATDTRIEAGFYFAAAAFVLFSFGMQWRINKAHLRNQKAARARWLATLYAYVSQTERRELAESPIQDAVTSYKRTRTALLVVYLLLASVLVGGGVLTLSTWSAGGAPAAGLVDTGATGGNVGETTQTHSRVDPPRGSSSEQHRAGVPPPAASGSSRR